MAILKYKNSDGAWQYVTFISEEVKYTEQALTDEQKEQARLNIGAITIPVGTTVPETLEEGQFFGLIEE